MDTKSIFDSLSPAFNFIYDTLSSVVSFISSNNIVRWFVIVPIASAVTLIIIYLILDLSHVLDDFKVKRDPYKKYQKRYQKNQSSYRKYNNNKSYVNYGTFNKSVSDKSKPILSYDEFSDNRKYSKLSEQDKRDAFAKQLPNWGKSKPHRHGFNWYWSGDEPDPTPEQAKRREKIDIDVEDD